MARHSIPRVIDDRLIPSESANQSFSTIQVGSKAWYAWLTEPNNRSFAFQSPQGTLTARREHRHGTWYWYAYRSQNGHLHKADLGKSVELSLERLQEAAALLSAEVAGHRLRSTRHEWVAGLTDREIEVLRLVARGLSNRQMATLLSISPSTIHHHIQHIYAKIGVSTRAAATLFAMQHHLLNEIDEAKK